MALLLLLSVFCLLNSPNTPRCREAYVLSFSFRCLAHLFYRPKDSKTDTAAVAQEETQISIPPTVTFHSFILGHYSNKNPRLHHRHPYHHSYLAESSQALVNYFSTLLQALFLVSCLEGLVSGSDAILNL